VNVQSKQASEFIILNSIR